MNHVVLFYPKSGEDQKKVFTAIWHYIRPEPVGFIRANRHFLFDHPALNSSWGYAKSRWGDAYPRVPPTISVLVVANLESRS